MEIGDGFQRHAAIFIQNTFKLQHAIKQTQETRLSHNIQRIAIISDNQDRRITDQLFIPTSSTVALRRNACESI
jgi:hypothetical protein